MSSFFSFRSQIVKAKAGQQYFRFVVVRVVDGNTRPVAIKHLYVAKHLVTAEKTSSFVQLDRPRKQAGYYKIEFRSYGFRVGCISAKSRQSKHRLRTKSRTGILAVMPS